MKFSIRGMGCAACAAKVEKAVSALTDVESVSVNLLTNSMSVEGKIKPADVIAAVEAAGYSAEEIIEISEESLKDKESSKILKRFIISIILLIPLMYLSMAVPMFSAPVPEILNGTMFAWCIIAILSLVVIIINFKFYISGFRSLINRSPNMDLLVSLGSGVSFIYSTVWLVITFANNSIAQKIDATYTNNFFFDSAAMILVLVTIGKYIESKSKSQVTSAIKKLMKLAPKEAILFDGGVEKKVNVEDIRVGNIFVVKPGMSIPVDGKVIDGVSAVDESMITGESIPVDKDLGDMVYSGTININGYLRCTAIKTHAKSTLAEIIKLTISASEKKAPIARLADKVAAVFVPVVCTFALITFVVWMIISGDIATALTRGVSVLVVSCPCALGLATPVAIMVATGVGASHGILFKSGEVLEKLGKVKTALIDKTGTITAGTPIVTNIVPLIDMESDELLEIAYAVEARSEHPLSKAVVKAATEMFGERKIGEIYSKSQDFSTYKNAGVKAKYNGHDVLAGNAKLILSELGVDIDKDKKLSELSNRFSFDGKTVIYYAVDNKLIGIIAIADTTKEDSIAALKMLDKMKVSTIMLTGDNKDTAVAIAKQAGITKIVAGVKPEGKVKAVEQMKEDLLKEKSNDKRNLVAMVGDGINDAPALASADIGVAIAAGSDIAHATADVILMKNNLTDFAKGIKISKIAIKNIKENLFFAFCYNIIGIPLAAGVFIPLFGWSLTPMFGAACMSASSIFVVLNALRIRAKKI